MEKIHQLDSSLCPIELVTVFLDKAEVTRIISFPLDQEGEHTVKVSGLPINSDSESFRIEAISSLKILDVSSDTEYYSKESSNINQPIKKDYSLEITELKKNILEYESEIYSIEKSVQRNSEHNTFLKQFVEKSLTSTRNKDDLKSLPLEEVSGLFDFYRKESKGLDDENLILKNKKSELNEKLSDCIDRLAQISNRKSSNTINNSKKSINTRCSIIHFLIEKETLDISNEVKLKLSYIVRDSSWRPSYDLRVLNNHSTSSTVSASLSYFALVNQKTGEDWNQCRLQLSTSNPSIASEPPVVSLKTISFQNYNWRRKSAYNNMEFFDDTSRERATSISLLDETEAEITDNFALPQSAQAKADDYISARVIGSGDAGSTVFSIPRLANIPSDGQPHKVCISTHDLPTPQIVHYAVPSISSQAHLQATFLNSTGYPLLFSEQVSIFVDGAFISKSKMVQTGLNEKFSLFLGVDPAIKISTTPVHHHEQKKGWITDIQQVRKVYQSATVSNTKANSFIRIILAEGLPKSENEKILVSLIEPAPASLMKSGETLDLQNLSFVDSEPKDFVSLNKSNDTIIWFKTIAPSQKVELNLSYKISWPQGMEIYIQ